MTDYLLIDKADGEELDRYRSCDDPQALRWALADAFVRAHGAPLTDDHREILGHWLDMKVEIFSRSDLATGQFGTFTVKAVQS